MLRDEVYYDAENPQELSDADPPRVASPHLDRLLVLVAHPRTETHSSIVTCRCEGAAKARWRSKAMQKRIKFRHTHGVCNAVRSVPKI